MSVHTPACTNTHTQTLANMKLCVVTTLIRLYRVNECVPEVCLQEYLDLEQQ